MRVKTRTNAPILWFGDYVDYGSVHEVHSRFAKDQGVHIEVDLGQVLVRRRPSYEPLLPHNRTWIDLKFSLELVENDDKTRLESFTISCGNDKLSVKFDGRGAATSVTVNNNNYINFFPNERFRFFVSEIIPQILIRSPDENLRGPYYDTVRRNIDTVDKEIRRLLSTKLHGRVSGQKITELSRRVQYRPGNSFIIGLKNVNSALKSWRNLVDSLSEDSAHSDVTKLRELAMLSALPDLLLALEVNIGASASAISYVGPFRATGERYYRIQELAIDEIDPEGKNLPMFLHSLPQAQLQAFSSWLENAIGYAIRLEKSAGHIQIELRDLSSNAYYNIADMGYGFSQVLPIMAQIWSREHKHGVAARESIVAMEQPELHLHPAYQAKIADVLARSIIITDEEKNERRLRETKFIIETHSEAIINRMGELIVDGVLDHNDVAIYIFEKRQSEQVTNIRRAQFDQDGVLCNWPVGFFSTKAL